MMKTRKDNNVIDRIGTVYAENDIELSWSIGRGVVCDKKNRENNDMTD